MNYNHITTRIHKAKTSCILIACHFIGHPNSHWLWPGRKEFAHLAATLTTLTTCIRLRKQRRYGAELVEKLGHYIVEIYGAT